VLKLKFMFVLFAMSYFLKRVNLMLFNDIIHLGSVSNNMTRNQKSRSTLNSRRSSGRIGSQSRTGKTTSPKIQEIIEGVVNVHYPKKSKFS
jgi:hypothetical protein